MTSEKRLAPVLAGACLTGRPLFFLGLLMTLFHVPFWWAVLFPGLAIQLVMAALMVRKRAEVAKSSHFRWLRIWSANYREAWRIVSVGGASTRELLFLLRGGQQ